MILTASVSDGSLSHLGSESGKVFLEDHDDIKSQFLGFCLKRKYKNFKRMIFLFTANGFFCHLLKTIDNLGLDQALQLLAPDLDPNCLLLWLYIY